MSTIDVR